MGIENADYIPELVQSSPLGSAAVAEGDNELRQLKKVLQQQFPDVPSGAIINAGENPSEPAEGLGAPTNVMLWSPLAIADFVKKYWSGWGLSPPSGQASCKVTRNVVFNVSNNTPTKLEYNVISWDTASWWDAANHYYVPQEAGIWRAKQVCFWDPNGAVGSGRIAKAQIRSNGLIVAEEWTLTEGNELFSSPVDTLVEVNGTTDTIEAWVEHGFNAGDEQTGQTPRAYFEIHRIGDA